MKIKGYTILCEFNKNQEQLSHDWGGEFYYDREAAECRIEELEDVSEGVIFWVKEAMLDVPEFDNLFMAEELKNN